MSPKLDTRQRLPPFPVLAPNEHSTMAARHEEGSPRRLAPQFTRKRDVSELYDSQGEQLTVWTSAVQQTSVSESYPSSRIDDTAAKGSSTVAKPKRKRANTQRRREQCRSNQALYRERQRGFIHELQSHVCQLRDEVHMLSVQRYTLCYGVQTKNNVWNVITEYFRLFRFGYLGPVMKLSDGTPTSVMPNFEDLECFLRAAMAPDVAFGELNGVDDLIQQWQRYSTYFSNLRFHLERLEEQPFGAIVATASLSLTITEATLRCVFPHLLESSSTEAGTENFLLCSRLLGQRIVCRCSVRFLWDDSTKRVARLDCTMDLLTSLLRVLGPPSRRQYCAGKGPHFSCQSDR